MSSFTRSSDIKMEKIHQREDRFFSLDGQWYFTTREGVVMGPFTSQKIATAEVKNYIAFVNTETSPAANLIKRKASYGLT